MKPTREFLERVSKLKRGRAESIALAGNQRIVELDGPWALVSEQSVGWFPSQNLNRVIDLSLVEPSAALLAMVERVYSEVPRHFAYLEPCDSYEEWVNTLASNHYYLGIAMSVLVGPTDCPSSDCTHDVRVVDAMTVNDLAHVLTEAGTQPATTADTTLGLVGEPGNTVFVAYAGGEPVAAAALTLHEGLAYLSSAYTRRDHRTKGAQTDLVRARLRFAREAGADTAFSETYRFIGSSYRNLERCGLREQYQRLIWRFERNAALRRGLSQTLDGHPEP